MINKAKATISQSTIEMDKLFLNHANIKGMHKELQVAMNKWRWAIDHIKDDSDLVCLWYLIRFKKPPAWERMDRCEKEYDVIEAKWKKELSKYCGQYWNEP